MTAMSPSWGDMIGTIHIAGDLFLVSVIVVVVVGKPAASLPAPTTALNLVNFRNMKNRNITDRTYFQRKSTNERKLFKSIIPGT